MFTHTNSFLVRERILIDGQRPFFRSRVSKDNPFSHRTPSLSPFHICRIPLSAVAGKRRDWGGSEERRILPLPSTHPLLSGGTTSLQGASPRREDHSLPQSRRRESLPSWKGEQLTPRREGKRETPDKTLSSKGKSVATVCVQSTRNNTILTLIDPSGKTKGWTSSGCLGFRNTRKSTTYAAQAAAESLAGKALAFGFVVVRVKVKGVGYGKQSSVRALQKSGLRVVSVEETTPIPYNGCRLPKKRRT